MKNELAGYAEHEARVFNNKVAPIVTRWHHSASKRTFWIPSASDTSELLQHINLNDEGLW